MAVDVLMSRGVPEERILFLNLISSPQGAENFAKRFPKLRVVTAFIDEGLDEKKFVDTERLCEQLLTDIVVTLSQDLATLATDSTPCDTTQIEKEIHNMKYQIPSTLGKPSSGYDDDCSCCIWFLG